MNQLARPNGAKAAALASQSAYNGLCAVILGGDFEPGTFIERAVACEATGVYNTPVREALTQLAIEGYVEQHPRGAMLKPITGDEFFDRYEVRHMVESRAVRRICLERRPISQVFHEICATYDEIEEGDHLTFAELNRLFFEAIMAAFDSKVLLQVFENLYANLTRMAMLSFRLGMQSTSEGGQHRQLAEVLEAPNVHLALERVDIHLIRMLRLVASLSGSARLGRQVG